MQGEPSIYHSLVLAERNQGEVPAQHWEIPPPTSPGGCRVSVPNVVVQQRVPPCQIVGGEVMLVLLLLSPLFRN